MRPITEQTILITGATDGLGQAVALELARQGAALLLHGRDPDRGRRTLQRITEQTGNDNLSYFNADFASLADANRLADEVLAHTDRLDLLVNNAGLGVELDRRDSHDDTR